MGFSTLPSCCSWRMSFFEEDVILTGLLIAGVEEQNEGEANGETYGVF